MRFFYITFILLFSFSLIFADEVFKFFEFAPREEENIILKDKILIQPFIAFNDYLSIIGFWLENPTTTKINLKILSQNNNLIFEKIFTIPTIEESWWGEEYLFPLGENLNINSGETYKIIIEPLETSNLKFFVKNLIELLQGPETYLYFPETLKPLIINNKGTDFTLKLSLYEGRENSSPVISNLRTIINSPQMVTIAFNSNEPITSKIDYKSNSENSTSTYQIDYFQSCPPGIKDCFFNLEVLPGKIYNFILKVSDFWGNFTLVEGSFQTPTQTQNEYHTTTPTPSIRFQQVQQNQQIIENNQKFISPRISFDEGKEKIKSKEVPEGKIQTSVGNVIELSPSKVLLPAKETDESPTPTIFSFTTSEIIAENISKKINFEDRGKNIFINSNLKFIFLIIFILLSLLIPFFVFKKKKIFFKKRESFTLLEVLITLALIGFVILSLFLLILNIANFNTFFVFNLGSHQEMLLFFKEIEKELRTIQSSNIGNYPIEEASSTRITFYSDLNDDGLVERVRYYIYNDELRKSVITPSGNPLTYNSLTEKTFVVVKNLVVPQVIFTYFDQTMSTTTDISKIKTIRVNLKVFQSLRKSTLENYIIVSPRNLGFK
jgi:hypothetical protein